MTVTNASQNSAKCSGQVAGLREQHHKGIGNFCFVNHQVLGMRIRWVVPRQLRFLTANALQPRDGVCTTGVVYLNVGSRDPFTFLSY